LHGYCGYGYSVGFPDLCQHHTCHGLPTLSATCSHTGTHGLSHMSNTFSPLPTVTHLLLPPFHCCLELTILNLPSHAPSPALHHLTHAILSWLSHTLSPTPHCLACIVSSLPTLACNPSHLPPSHHCHLKPACTISSPLWYVFSHSLCHLTLSCSPLPSLPSCCPLPGPCHPSHAPHPYTACCMHGPALTPSHMCAPAVTVPLAPSCTCTALMPPLTCMGQ